MSFDVSRLPLRSGSWHFASAFQGGADAIHSHTLPLEALLILGVSPLFRILACVLFPPCMLEPCSSHWAFI